MISTLFVAALLVFCAAADQAASEPAYNKEKAAQLFRENGLKLWPEVLRIAEVEKEMQAPMARYAALIPTDAAVEAFLNGMGLTMSDLAARPQLAKHLVAHHLVLALPPNAQQALEEGKLLSVPTAAATDGRGNNLTTLRAAMRSADGSSGEQRLYIMDGQGNTAAAVKFLRQDSNKVVILIDKVLSSGSYYPNLASLCKHRAAQAGSMCEALTQSGIVQNTSSPAFSYTILMPGPKALQRAGLSGATSIHVHVLGRQQMVELVKHHVVPGVHAFPDGFKAGGTYATMLPGAGLKIEYSGDLQQALKSDNGSLQAQVVLPDGQRVPVVVYNVFVGQGVVHGLSAVLFPPGFKSNRPQPATTAAAVPGKTAAEQGRSAAAPAAGGRRLLGNGIDDIPNVIMPMNSAESSIRSKTRSMFKDAEDRWS